MKDYYKILEIQNNSSFDEIKQAYRKLAFKYHPDYNTSINASSLFREITEAYEILRDTNKRVVYDSMFNKNIVTDIVINKWQEAAHKKADEYANMNYNSFKEMLLEEFKVAAKNSPNFGCLIILLIGFFGGVWFVIKAAIEEDDMLLKIGGGNIIFYLILIIYFYPKISRAYNNDRSKINK